MNGYGVRFGRPSPALVISVIAMFLAASGSVYAHGKIGTKDLKNGAVSAKKLKNGAVTAKKLRKNAVTAKKIRKNAVSAQKIRQNAVRTGKIQDNAVTGAKVDESTLGKVPSAAAVDGLAVLPMRRAALSNHPTLDAAAARAAAPEVPLYSKGQLTIYGKCFRPDSGNLHVGAYIKTSANGAVFDGYDDLQGGPAAGDFLNTNTSETNARVHDENQLLADRARADNPLTDAVGAFTAASPDGTTIAGQLLTGAKQGNAPHNGGALGSADGCQWWGYVIG